MSKQPQEDIQQDADTKAPESFQQLEEGLKKALTVSKKDLDARLAQARRERAEAREQKRAARSKPSD